MPGMPKTRQDPVELTLTRAEALALEYAAEKGLVAIEAFALAQRTGSAEHALSRLRAAIAGAAPKQPAAADEKVARRRQATPPP
jgi:hypothetical protein